MNRRDFIKAASGGGIAVGRARRLSAMRLQKTVRRFQVRWVCCMTPLCAWAVRPASQSVRISTFPARNPEGEQTWSNNDKLSPYTNNIIQVWRSGTGVNKDQEENGYAYIKKQCMHCVDPNCVSVCPVSALKKDPKTGIVHYDKDVCTGCRYCMVACPYNVPKYDYNNPFGALHKCELCNQKGVERLDKGGLPGCVEVCPAGAVIFGTREELMAEAKKRLALKPGSEYHYPRQTLKTDDTYLHTVPKYYPHLYGEKEGGGTPGAGADRRSL
ncbi:hydrogenase-2 small subunit [Salmonella enterica subsp. enterica serovar Typhimurium]|nr:hydrogenase-2 small subunit [Salmonella enterica subsp. enterica serovar Typhimurium]